MKGVLDCAQRNQSRCRDGWGWIIYDTGIVPPSPPFQLSDGRDSL